ncbi:DNA-directed RNA polymerase subunit beta' [Patescibacteria group bacterium]|nr:DNA-directed RNA polymerase subunit beta' [Patescibacteria group bacterium]
MLSDFKAIKLKLASPDTILDWSHGEVKKPETINYRTQRPEKDGLFCEKIFGPTKDWECYCGKYKRIRYKGVVCDKCGVEVTRSIVRRDRMGHIALAAPVSHIWFLRGVPSKIGLLLDLSFQKLERVIYFADYIIISVDEQAKAQALESLDGEYKSKKKSINKKYKDTINELRSKEGAKGKSGKDDISRINKNQEKELAGLEKVFKQEKSVLKGLKKMKIISELEYRDLSLKYGQVFQAGIGAEAVRKLLAEIDLAKLAKHLEAESKQVPASQRKKMKRRINLIYGMANAQVKPEWMMVSVLPVLPPDLRPMVQLDGGRFAASDLNDLYRRVINRNNRLRRLIELDAPEVIRRNEKRMLQEAVDALIDNSARHGTAAAASTGKKRPLKSLADMLKGKQGRFRQNLLGKRVDYSGRSVIVVGPKLSLHECGIPKIMALELFKPFVINKLITNELAYNVRSATRLIEEGKEEIWDMLEEVIKDHRILLNRAPTLHRLSIQAFQPRLIEGKAIQVHPMVCASFNADFDGDQMAAHVPITPLAREEAKTLMASEKNLLKPATGAPSTTASQDIVLGCYYMTNIKPGVLGEGKYFTDIEEALLAYQNNQVDIRAKIKIRIDGQIQETCVGRAIFNQILPKEMWFVNKTLDKKSITKIISQCLERFSQERTVQLVDNLKDIGFKYLTKSGLSWSMDDLHVPPEKPQLMEKARGQVEEVRQQFKMGLLTDEERYRKIIEIWSKIKDEITEVAVNALDKYGPVYMMVESGARGSWPQIVQMSGMRGLMAAPSGKTIELPVKNSFKEGLGVLEYFISTHGARKGLSDTALRTANAGYLTRRLIDVAQDMVVEKEDCGDKEGIEINRQVSEDMNKDFFSRLVGRTAMEDITIGKDKIVAKDEVIGREMAEKIDQSDLDNIKIRSMLTCKLCKGVCQKCYGWDLGRNELVAIGEAVGIIAAQSIGEPGTQLTMRTFHTGGVAGEGDITQGLPRVEELFEARGIKKPAVVADIDGLVHIEEEKDQKILRIISSEVKKDNYNIAGGKTKAKDGDHIDKDAILAQDAKGKDIKAQKAGFVKIEGDKLSVIHEGGDEKEYVLPSNAVIWVEQGEIVAKGQQLTEGTLDLQHLFKVGGRTRVQKYILKEAQFIYSSQGQDVSDKHIEIVIRQMLSRVKIVETGDSDLLVGSIEDRVRFEVIRAKLKKEGKRPPESTELLLGVTKASLTTPSFLSAASFQETSRVLIDASIVGKTDELRGLKENVIIGKLIPSGTGYRNKAGIEAK